MSAKASTCSFCPRLFTPRTNGIAGHREHGNWCGKCLGGARAFYQHYSEARLIKIWDVLRHASSLKPDEVTMLRHIEMVLADRYPRQLLVADEES